MRVKKTYEDKLDKKDDKDVLSLADADDSKVSSITLSQLTNQFILNILVHACDIGNVCLEFQNYLNWAILIS